MQKFFSKFINILGILLILAGLVLVGHYAWGKIQVAYYQNQLRQIYEESLLQIPDPYQREEGHLNYLWERVQLLKNEPVKSSRYLHHVVFREWVPMRLAIPKINVDLVVLTGGVFDTDLLDKAPVHYEMSDLPSTESGNVAIAGHRAGRWGFFYHLHELEEGDKIYLYTGGYRFTYLVTDVFIIEPTDWSVIHTTEVPTLTLTTCEPLNRRATHRLVARAELDNVTPMSRK